MVDFNIYNSYVDISTPTQVIRRIPFTSVSIDVGLSNDSYQVYVNNVVLSNTEGIFSNFSLDGVVFLTDDAWREFYSTTFTDNNNLFTSINELRAEIEKLTWSAYIYSDLPLVNQTALFEPYFIRDTFPNVVDGLWSLTYPYDGDYEITFGYTSSINVGNESMETDLTINGISSVYFTQIEYKESGGGGLPNVPTVANRVLTGGSVNTRTSQRLQYTKSFIVTRTAGTTDLLDAVFRGTDTNQEPCIYSAILKVDYKVNKNE